MQPPKSKYHQARSLYDSLATSRQSRNCVQAENADCGTLAVHESAPHYCAAQGKTHIKRMYSSLATSRQSRNYVQAANADYGALAVHESASQYCATSRQSRNCVQAAAPRLYMRAHHSTVHKGKAHQGKAENTCELRMQTAAPRLYMRAHYSSVLHKGGKRRRMSLRSVLPLTRAHTPKANTAARSCATTTSCLIFMWARLYNLSP